MAEQVSPLAGKTVEPSMLVNVARLVTAYFTGSRTRRSRRNASRSARRAIADRPSTTPSTRRTSWRSARRSAVTGAAPASPARCLSASNARLSEPALASALEVFAANGVDVMIDEHDGYTPTPVISHAILTYNRGRKAVSPTGSSSRLRIIPRGRRLQIQSAKWRTGRYRHHVRDRARSQLVAGKRSRRPATHSIRSRLKSPQVHRHDYIGPYVADLANVVDMDAIRHPA